MEAFTRPPSVPLIVTGRHWCMLGELQPGQPTGQLHGHKFRKTTNEM